MAHYAKVDENNLVTEIFVGRNEDDPLPEGVSSWEEYYGALRYSYNTVHGEHRLGGTPFRKNPASIGYTYDPVRDAFIPPKPPGMHSWIIDEETCDWTPPVPYPDINSVYRWNEEEVKWDFVAVKPPNDGKIYAWDDDLNEWIFYVPPSDDGESEGSYYLLSTGQLIPNK